jgi:undecaprenyl-diphosphatase
VNGFDFQILSWASRCNARWPGLDEVVWWISSADLIKGQVFVCVIWWLWFSRADDQRRTREILLATLASAFAAIVAGRGLAHLLPFRMRPMFIPELGFTPPARELAEHGMRFWSAFPSDHAMLFAALATGFWTVSPRIGAAAHLYWIVVVGLPRVYLGLHHPTDVLGGGLIGIAFAWAFCRPKPREAVAAPLLGLSDARPGPFYAVFFLISVQIGAMFSEPRTMVGHALRLLRGKPLSASAK